jgi:hypothetical protein
MGNPTKKFNDFDKLRQRFDGSDPLLRGLKTGSTSRSGHDQRVANTPEWLMNDAAVRVVLLRAFPKMDTNPTQRKRAERWALIIHYYFRLACTASHAALWLRHDDAKKSGIQDWETVNAPVNRAAEEKDIENLTKRVEDTVARILRTERGLRTDCKPRIGKMGRPRKV